MQVLVVHTQYPVVCIPSIYIIDHYIHVLWYQQLEFTCNSALATLLVYTNQSAISFYTIAALNNNKFFNVAIDSRCMEYTYWYTLVPVATSNIICMAKALSFICHVVAESDNLTRTGRG